MRVRKKRLAYGKGLACDFSRGPYGNSHNFGFDTCYSSLVGRFVLSRLPVASIRDDRCWCFGDRASHSYSI